MPFTPGHAKIPGSGVKKGQKLVLKETARETFVRLTGKGPIQYCMELMEKLSERDRLKASLELLPYLEPKLAQTQITADVSVEAKQVVENLYDEFERISGQGMVELPPPSDSSGDTEKKDSWSVQKIPLPYL